MVAISERNHQLIARNWRESNSPFRCSIQTNHKTTCFHSGFSPYNTSLCFQWGHVDQSYLFFDAEWFCRIFQDPASDFDNSLVLTTVLTTVPLHSFPFMNNQFSWSCPNWTSKSPHKAMQPGPILKDIDLKGRVVPIATCDTWWHPGLKRS